MADWFVDDAAADNTGSGAWNSPYKYLWLADGSANPGLFNDTPAPAAGDTVYVLTGHSELESTAAQIQMINAGTAASPIKIIAVSSFNSGSPNTLASARSCTVGHTSSGTGKDVQIRGYLVMYGFILDAGDEIITTGDLSFVLTGGRLKQQRSGGAYGIRFYSADIEQVFELIDTDVYTVGNVNFEVGSGNRLIWRGGTLNNILASNPVFESFNRGARVECHAVDLSVADKIAGDYSGINPSGLCELFGCKLKSGVTIADRPSHKGLSVRCYNSDNVAGNRRYDIVEDSGDVLSETTVVRTGGANTGEGSGTHAIKMVGLSATNLVSPLRTLTINGWADFSSSKTIDIYIANNTRDLNDTEIWVELGYPAYNAAGRKRKTSQGTNWLVAPTTITDDTGSTWGTSPTYMQKISVTAGGSTDGREGEYTLTVALAANVTVYVDPEPVVT